jgi:hypothetical protein
MYVGGAGAPCTVRDNCGDWIDGYRLYPLLYEAAGSICDSTPRHASSLLERSNSVCHPV